MAKYFSISNGLRGLYMPDDVSFMRFDTRRALRNFLTWESDQMREAHGYGGTKREIAWTAAQAWKAEPGDMPLAITFGRTRSGNDRPFGVFVQRITRDDYLACMGE
jgi:hypothetical protein